MKLFALHLTPLLPLRPLSPRPTPQHENTTQLRPQFELSTICQLGLWSWLVPSVCASWHVSKTELCVSLRFWKRCCTKLKLSVGKFFTALHLTPESRCKALRVYYLTGTHLFMIGMKYTFRMRTHHKHQRPRTQTHGCWWNRSTRKNYRRSAQ